MSRSVVVPALRAFLYRDRAYAKGDPVTMSPLDASIHARRGDVSLSSSYRTKVATPEESPEKPSRRRYRRRDMVAEK